MVAGVIFAVLAPLVRIGAALRDFSPAYVRFGSWLCENSSARRARRNISKKLRTMESNRAARTVFDTLLENCIFYISQLYEFSHRLGQTRSFGDVCPMSALPSKADVDPRSCDVAKVPGSDI